MLTPEEIAHFKTFGYLLLRQVFDVHEMTTLIRAAEDLWASDATRETDKERRFDAFFERSPLPTSIVTDDRIYPVVEDLLGSGFLWVGSEGNISNRSEVNWHPDRKYYREGEGHWIDYLQLKVMMYLEKVTRETGCLRVIPGSHRMPLHKDLAAQEIDPKSKPFGVEGKDLPCAALESEPGDVILFNHCIWHSAYGGGKDRRYVAMKYAARPFEKSQLVSLERYTPKVFEPHSAFVNHKDGRIKELVDSTSAKGELTD